MAVEAINRQRAWLANEPGITSNIILVLACAGLAFTGILLSRSDVGWDNGRLFLAGAGVAVASSVLIGLIAAVWRIVGGSGQEPAGRASKAVLLAQLGSFLVAVVLLLVFFAMAFVF